MGSDVNRSSFIRSHFFSDMLYQASLSNLVRSRIAAVQAKATTPFPYKNLHRLDDAKKRTFVLILGESASRFHYSLYGYPRPTSPELDAQKESLLVYTNAISMFGSTDPSLNAAFIFSELQGTEEGIASILTLHREAGFKVWWISNSTVEALGKGASWFPITADVVTQKNMATHFVQQHRSYDDVLIPELQQALHDKYPDKFIVLHLSGVHSTFQHRYPDKERFFDDDDTKEMYATERLAPQEIAYINHYDNALRYNNKIVNEIIRVVEAYDAYAYVTYLSDHSVQLFETPDTFAGQSATQGTQYLYGIPFIVWLSLEYKRQNALFAERLRQTTERFWKMDDSFAFSMADLSRLRFDQFRPERSLFSEHYVTPDTRLGDGTNYQNLPGHLWKVH